jgi:acid phosphatase type 7
MIRRPRRLLAALAALAALSGAVPILHAADTVLLKQGSALWYHEGQQTLTPGWEAPDAGEGSGWIHSPAGFGIGYGDGDDSTVLSSMKDNYLTVYVRAHFTASASEVGAGHVTLDIWYDDGFIVWLNGQEIGRANMPYGTLSAWTEAYLHEADEGPVTFMFDPEVLKAGDNVLAVEVHNGNLDSSDLSFLPILTAHDAPPPGATVTRGPFVQQVSRRGALIVWETSAAVPTALQWGLDPELTSAAGDGVARTHHVVALEGLEPGARYAWRVEGGEAGEQRGAFWTRGEADEPTRAVVFGDTRSYHTDHATVVGAIVTAEPRVAFHSGDLINNGELAAEWDTFFSIEAPLLQIAPLYPTIGNHEEGGGIYLDVFELPENSPSPERYYSVRVGAAQLVVLDQYGSSLMPGGEQYQWLEARLSEAAADPGVRLSFVMLHHGPYDSGAHGSNFVVRQNLVPLFEAHGVDAVFSGHDHDYERGEVNGVQYVVSGGGGAPLYDVSGDWWTQAAASVLHFCTLDLHGPRATFQAIGLDGLPFDGFTVGDHLTECVSPEGCEGQAPGNCPNAGEGAWACVEGGCVWTCRVPTPVVTEPDPAPDVVDAEADQAWPGFVDGGGADGVQPEALDEAAAPHGGGDAADEAGAGSGGDARGGDGGSGCAWVDPSVAVAHGPTPALALGLLMMSVRARRRRALSGDHSLDSRLRSPPDLR